VTHGRRGERGAELIEFAFALPVLLLVFAGIIDFGLLFQRYEVVTNAAREGARIASLPGYTNADVTARVNAYITNGIAASATATTTVTDVSIAVATGPAVQAKQVQVAYSSNFIIIGPISSLFGGGGSFGTITLTGRSTMRMEVPSS
jgi:Flp pilus assembly protein TadG